MKKQLSKIYLINEMLNPLSSKQRDVVTIDDVGIKLTCSVPHCNIHHHPSDDIYLMASLTYKLSVARLYFTTLFPSLNYLSHYPNPIFGPSRITHLRNMPLFLISVACDIAEFVMVPIMVATATVIFHTVQEIEFDAIFLVEFILKFSLYSIQNYLSVIQQ